jgi:hypothetical protein
MKKRKAAQWLPIQFADVERINHARLLSDSPASWLDAFGYAWVCAHRGAPLTRRQLAAWAGWSQRQAAGVLREVKTRQAAWEASHPGDPGSIQPAEPETIHPSPVNPKGCEVKRSRNDPGSIQDRSDRARGSTSTSTSTSTQDRTRTRASNHPCPLEEDDRITAQDAEQFLARLHSFRR